MIGYPPLIRIVNRFLILICMFGIAVLYAKSDYKILYINSYHPGYQWSDDIYRGINDFYKEKTKLKIDLRVEYLDGKRYEKALKGSAGQHLAMLWSEKYKDLSFDLILVSDQVAFDFVNQLDTLLFHHAPMLFAGVENFENRDRFISGISSSTKILGNIELILKVLPETRKIHIITDQSATGQANRAKIEIIKKQLFDQVEIVFFEQGQGISQNKLLEKVTQLPADEPVFFLDYYIDDQNNYINIAEILPKITKLCQSPVFSHVDLYTNFGVVGGLMNSGYYQGRQLAEASLMVLQNNYNKNQKIINEIAYPIFQYPLLQKYGINKKKLPENSVLYGYKEIDFTKYYKYIALILIIIVTQTFFIIWLILVFKKLKKSQAKFRKIVESLPVAVGIANLKGEIYYINPQFIRTFGYALEDIQDIQSWAKKAYPDEEYRKKIFEIWNKDVEWAVHNPEKLTPIRLNKMVSSDGQEHDIELSFTLIDNDLYAVFNEVTNQKKAENDLKESENLFRSIYDLLPYSCVIHNLDDTLFMVNKKFCTNLGLSENEIIGKSTKILGMNIENEHSEDIKREIIHKGFIENKVVKVNYKNRMEPSFVIYTSKLSKIRGENRIISTTVDVTDRINAESALLESEKRVRLQKSAIVNMILNRNLNPDQFEDNLQIFTKILSETMKTTRVSIWSVGENYKDFICLDLFDSERNLHTHGERLNPQDLPGYWDTLLKENRICVEDTNLDKRTKEIYSHYLQPLGITSLLDAGIFAEGKLIGVVSFENTREFRKWLPDEESFASNAAALIGQFFVTIEKMKKDKIILEKNKELEQILYVASHDLRSPLVNVDGYGREIDLTIKDLEEFLSVEENRNPEVFPKRFLADSEDIRKSVQRIRNSARQMDVLLSGLLKISRTGRAALKLEILNMNELVNKVIVLNEFRINENKADIIVGNLPDCFADEMQMIQIITNLLTNSLKFASPERKCVLLITGKTEKNFSLYSFKDNGIGIAPEHQQKIFELFHRLDPLKYEGEGIGLTIVKQIINRLNGKIMVQSDRDKGCEFAIYIPSKES